ncbi:hypothetical protein D6764_00420 [Candidatus Woesearchaeota archaeon]|nr:MAG: hypothetical protein D6764_00420 [Candidatus Woesearchaeota archaeon]
MGKLMLFIVGFFLLGGYIIYQGYHYDLDNPQDRKSFAKQFAKWVWDVGKKTKNVVAYVIKEDWLPEAGSSVNETNRTEEEKINPSVTVTLS